MKVVRKASFPSIEGTYPPGGRLRRVAGRYGWGFADQILSSLTNFALGILVARTVTLKEFGMFAVAFATYVLSLGAVRAMTSEPLTVRHSASDTQQWRQATAHSTGAALTIGFALGLGCLLVGSVVGGQLGASLAALGVTLPGLLLQDTWRFAFFAASRGDKALVNDVIWALVLFLTLGFLLLGDSPPVWMIMAAWGGSATVAAAAGILQASLAPRPLATFRWIRAQKSLVPAFLVEFTASNGANQLVVYAAGLVNLGAAGALRGGQILLGPLNVLLMGSRIAVLPEAVRLAKKGPRMLLPLSGFLALILAAAAISWGVLIRVIPEPLGASLLGSSWEAGHQVVFPLAVASAGAAVIMGALIGLRSLASVTRSLRARLLTGALILPAGIGGAALDGALGAAVGVAVGTWLAAGVWWLEFLTAMRTELPTSDRRGDEPTTVS
jgi:hypothetical protein